MKRILTAVVVLPFLIASILIASLWWVFVLLAAAAMVLGALGVLPAREETHSYNLSRGGLCCRRRADHDPATERSGERAARPIRDHRCHDRHFDRRDTARRAVRQDDRVSRRDAAWRVVYSAARQSSRRATHRFPQPLSAHLLSFFFLVLMGSDAGAYYTGRAFGKRKLAPSISPGKTWEGAVGGIVAALAMAALAHFWFFRELPLKYMLPLAAIMALLGILGDLAESALKRGAGAKDAANILPGHGGILDRLDSLLFNAPLIYYFARFYFQS